VATVIEAPLTYDDVCQLMSISRVTLWTWVRDGKFPQPLRPGGRRCYWSRRVIRDYLSGRHGRK
jgi:predicted DNA-binding transcriptional regulator AlpA